MKGWIKVHGANKTWQNKYLRAQDVYAIEEYTEDEKEGYKSFSCTLINDCYYVSETVEEVLALIEEAEGKKSLYKKLCEVGEECKRQLLSDMSKQCGCETCSYFDTDESWLCDLLRREKAPCDWDLDMIPEEYR